jgi:uncharacterized UPF0160 family protein
MFRIQSMSGKGSFESRAPLLEAWRGLRSEELKKIAGIHDIEFVHHAGFIGGAWSLESCVKMAEISLEEVNARKA